MRAKVSWVAANRFVGSAESGHGVIIESKSEEGPAIGPSALEVVLHAERAPEAPRVFTKADLEFVGEGTELNEAAMKRAVDLSMDKYCSVAAMLKRSGCEVEYRYRVRVKGPDTEGEAAPKRALPTGVVSTEVHPAPARDLPFPGPPGPRPHGDKGGAA